MVRSNGVLPGLVLNRYLLLDDSTTVHIMDGIKVSPTMVKFGFDGPLQNLLSITYSPETPLTILDSPSSFRSRKIHYHDDAHTGAYRDLSEPTSIPKNTLLTLSSTSSSDPSGTHEVILKCGKCPLPFHS